MSKQGPARQRVVCWWRVTSESVVAAGSRVARGGQVPSTLLYMACLFMVTDSGILISFDVRTKTTLFAFGRP